MLIAAGLLVSAQFSGHLAQDAADVAHDRDGTAVMHTRRAQHSQQAPKSRATVTREHDTDLAHLLPVTNAANDDLQAVRVGDLLEELLEQHTLLHELDHPQRRRGVSLSTTWWRAELGLAQDLGRCAPRAHGSRARPRRSSRPA